MKDNKLFSAMSYIDEELIDEALNAPRIKKLPVLKVTAAAAAIVFITLAATVLINVFKQPNIISESNTSNVQASKKTDKTEPESKEKEYEGTNTEQTSKSEQTVTSTEDTQASGQTPAEPPIDEDEVSDMLGFIITDDGKTYIQVFNNTQYTLEEDIGRAGDFRGCYSDLEDNSRVYTVKEDDNILVVNFETGGSVTLMLREEGLQDRMGYYRFNGLRVDSSLMAALSSGDGKTYSVYVTRPDSDDMYDYVYNGKTLRQMKEELEESWKTEHGKYNPLDEEFQAACHAFLKEKIKSVYDILKENGIQAELINEVRCEMTVTKDQFESLAACGSISEEYAFGLSAGGYFADDPEE